MFGDLFQPNTIWPHAGCSKVSAVYMKPAIRRRPADAAPITKWISARGGSGKTATTHTLMTLNKINGPIPLLSRRGDRLSLRLRSDESGCARDQTRTHRGQTTKTQAGDYALGPCPNAQAAVSPFSSTGTSKISPVRISIQPGMISSQDSLFFMPPWTSFKPSDPDRSRRSSDSRPTVSRLTVHGFLPTENGSLILWTASTISADFTSWIASPESPTE